MAAAAASVKAARLTTLALFSPTPNPFSATPAAHPEPVDPRKLRTALAHSLIVVSVFCGARFLVDAGHDQRFLGLGLGLGLGQQGDHRRLVGFGPAVSDVGLTASVHDVVVHASLQRRGIGRKILEKITRTISAGYSIAEVFMTFPHYVQKRRPFFEACGFGDDAMGSTTMMYTRNIKK